jgi:hypothetical protein
LAGSIISFFLISFTLRSMALAASTYSGAKKRRKQMTVKNRKNAVSHTARPPSVIVKAEQHTIVWSEGDFRREVEKARRIKPQKMSDADLLSFCRGAHRYFHAHFWADARPFFVELWKRIDNHEMPEIQNSKTEACKRIGCSIRWAQMIVRGTAKESNSGEAKEKKTKREFTSRQEPLTKDEYVFAISKFGFEMIQPLHRDNWELYREICAELGKQFYEASKTPDTDNPRLTGVEGKSVKNGQINNGDTCV